MIFQFSVTRDVVTFIDPIENEKWGRGNRNQKKWLIRWNDEVRSLIKSLFPVCYGRVLNKRRAHRVCDQNKINTKYCNIVFIKRLCVKISQDRNRLFNRLASASKYICVMLNWSGNRSVLSACHKGPRNSIIFPTAFLILLTKFKVLDN